MNYILVSIFLLLTMNTQVIFDFNSTNNIRYWRVVDDVVMGGRSYGNFSLNNEGHGVFEGRVSLENNGGFSSVRYQFNRVDVSEDSKLVLRLKGDGKRYQIRIKDNSDHYYSYIAYFETSGEWEIVEVPLSKMYATFRGRRLSMPNFSESSFEEIGFLIGNKRPEEFRLILDKIEVK